MHIIFCEVRMAKSYVEDSTIKNMDQSTEHLLLQRRSYDDQRHDLLSKVNELFQLQNIMNLPDQAFVIIW